MVQELPSGEWIDLAAPLSGAQVTRSLSAAASLSGTLPIELAHLTGRLREWGTAIYAVEGDQLRGGGIIPDGGVSYDDQQVSIDAVGPSSWLHGQPWLTADRSYIDADPATIDQDIWDRMQAWAGGFLGVTLDPLTTTKRIGEPERDVNFQTSTGQDVEFTAGPYRLSWWQTANVGQERARLLEDAGIEWQEVPNWAPGQARAVRWHIRRAFPRLGARRHQRLTVGAEIIQVPPVQHEPYSSDVLVLGAGEGSATVSATASRTTDRLRRAALVTAKGIGRRPTAETRARSEAARRTGTSVVGSIVVVPTETFDPWQVQPGDELPISGDAGWVQLDHWVRVIEITA
jgi:hypothetical protein